MCRSAAAEWMIVMYQDMMDTIGFVSKTDPEVGAAMGRELALSLIHI